MSEFQKRIVKEIKFYEEGKSPKIVIVALEDVEKMVDDAKKEFPNILEISKRILNDNTLGGDLNNHINSVFITKVDTWKEKWFGNQV